MPSTKTQDRIYQIRKALRLNRTEFGNLIGCSYRSVYYYETGARKPSFTTCYKIVVIARQNGIEDVDIEWLRPEGDEQ